MKLEIDQNIIDKACSLKMAEYEKRTKRTWLILNHLGLRLGQQGIYMLFVYSILKGYASFSGKYVVCYVFYFRGRLLSDFQCG